MSVILYYKRTVLNVYLGNKVNLKILVLGEFILLKAKMYIVHVYSRSCRKSLENGPLVYI